MERYSVSDYRYELARSAAILLVLLVALGCLLAHSSDSSEPSELTRHSRPVHQDESQGLVNLTSVGDDFALDDEGAGEFDSRITFALFIALFAGLITLIRPGSVKGGIEFSVNLFRYDSAFGYSPLRSPPSA